MRASVLSGTSLAIDRQGDSASPKRAADGIGVRDRFPELRTPDFTWAELGFEQEWRDTYTLDVELANRLVSGGPYGTSVPTSRY
jgi:hypothetical protein